MTDHELPITLTSFRKKSAQLLGVALLLLVLSLLGLEVKQVWLRPAHHELLTGTFLPEPRQMSAFNLVTEVGTPFTLADFLGHWTVMFAGYTLCPDVCPTTLAMLKAVKGQLGDDTKRLTVLFLSVDPEQDTPEQLESYIYHFDPDFHAVTGSSQQIEAIIANLGLAAFKETDSVNGHYEIGHSAQLILINPAGKIAAYLSPPFTTEALVADIRTTLETQSP